MEILLCIDFTWIFPRMTTSENRYTVHEHIIPAEFQLSFQQCSGLLSYKLFHCTTSLITLGTIQEAGFLKQFVFEPWMVLSSFISVVFHFFLLQNIHFKEKVQNRSEKSVKTKQIFSFFLFLFFTMSQTVVIFHWKIKLVLQHEMHQHFLLYICLYSSSSGNVEILQQESKIFSANQN